MSFPKKYCSVMLLIFALAAFTGLAPTGAYGIEPCSLGLKEPPFLAFGVDPNLLLLIDNVSGVNSNALGTNESRSSSVRHGKIKVKETK